MGKGTIWLLAASAAGAAACGARDSRHETPGADSERAAVSQIAIPRVDPALCDPKGKEVVTYDITHDGEPNIWELYETSDQGGTDVQLLTCKQVDFDGDGGKDYVAIYRETGELLAEEFDLTYDGNFDVRAHYDEKTARVYLAERASGFGEGYDVWEKYDDEGQLELVERDRSGDGRPDMWEQYEAGELVAILYDDTSDGRVDRREERPRAAPGADSDAETAEAPDASDAADEPGGELGADDLELDDES